MNQFMYLPYLTKLIIEDLSKKEFGKKKNRKSNVMKDIIKDYVERTYLIH